MMIPGDWVFSTPRDTGDPHIGSIHVYKYSLPNNRLKLTAPSRSRFFDFSLLKSVPARPAAEAERWADITAY
jgi:hypothetical protein